MLLPSENPSNLVDPAPDSRRSSLSILVVEDSRDAADILGMFLEAHGYDVAIAYDGEHAVNASIMRVPDLVIMDLGLPELNGFHASMEIRKRHPEHEIRFIALSGFDDRETVNRCLDYGFDSHVAKPADPNRLLELVRSFEANP